MVSAPLRLAYQGHSSDVFCAGSDVIHVNMLGQPIIVLNSAEAATDLLDKRGSIYSDRPAFAFFKSCVDR